MSDEERLEQDPESPVVTRWIPSALLDLPPLEPVFALRTPHRLCFQAMPSSRDVLRQLLQGRAFEVTVELDTKDAPLQHAPLQEIHAVRLTPDRPLQWDQYYWILDALLDDLREAPDPASGLARGRQRLLVAERTLRSLGHHTNCDPTQLQQAWNRADKIDLQQFVYKKLDPTQTLQQYARGLTGFLISHAGLRVFADWAADLLQEADKSGDPLPVPSERENAVLQMYLLNRLFGGAWLAAASGMVAGWHLLMSAHVLAVWFATLLMRAGYEREFEEALFGALWMLDHGFWSDEALVHTVAHNLNASEYTTVELALALTSAMRGERVSN